MFNIRTDVAARRFSQFGWKFFRAGILVGLMFVIIYPLMTVFTKAFRPLEEFANPSVIWITINPTLDNVWLSFQLLNFTQAFRNSVVISVGSAILQLIICSFVGYSFAKFNFPFKGLLFACVVLTMVVPPQMLFLPMYLQYAFFDFFGASRVIASVTGQPLTDYTVNLLNNPLTFIIPSAFGVGLRSGLFIYIFRQFFRNIPQELIDAARVDGCGAFMTYVRIMVPIARAAFLTVFLFSVVWHWNESVYTSLFFIRTEARPLSTMLQFILEYMRFSTLFVHDGRNVAERIAVANSAVLIYMAPLIILYLITQKFFVEGVETSGIKG